MAEAQQVSLKWDIPDEMPIVFANHLLVTAIDDNFVVTFFQVVPPIILEGEDVGENTYRTVPAKAVARLAIPPGQMKSMIDALSRHYERVTTKKQQSSIEEE